LKKGILVKVGQKLKVVGHSRFLRRINNKKASKSLTDSLAWHKEGDRRKNAMIDLEIVKPCN
jgi:hypothetical protein